MSFKHTVTMAVTTPGNQQVAPSAALEYTGDLEQNIDIDIPIATDTPVNFNLDVSAVKSFYAISTVNLTIETNDGTTPDNTLSLIAGKPYIWNTDSYDTFKFTADIDGGLFLTSLAVGTLKVRAIVDSTP